MDTEGLKKISLILTVVLTAGGAVGGFYKFAYDTGYKIGSAETKSSSWTNIMKSATDCDKRVQSLQDRLFDCRSSCK